MKKFEKPILTDGSTVFRLGIKAHNNLGCLQHLAKICLKILKSTFVLHKPTVDYITYT